MSVERSAFSVENSAPQGAVFLSYAREDTCRRQGYGGQAGRFRLLSAFSATFVFSQP